MTMQALALAFLSALTIGGLAWVFLYPLLSGEKQAEKRRASFTSSAPALRVDDRMRSRRVQVEDSMKELEQRLAATKKVSLSVRISQAGLTWTKQQFVIGSAILGAAVLIITFLGGMALLPAIGFAAAMGFGLPRWVLGFLTARRKKKFTENFAPAIDVIVQPFGAIGAVH